MAGRGRRMEKVWDNWGGEPGDLHFGAVLPDEVQLLQLRFRCVLEGGLRALCRSNLRGHRDCPTSGSGNGWADREARRLDLSWRGHADGSRTGTTRENIWRREKSVRGDAGCGDHSGVRAGDA